MPELHWRVRWPDASTTRCYSPSSTIRDAFRVGQVYTVPDFVERSRNALELASRRVAQRYGYGCAHAAVQMREIEAIARRFDQPAQTVVVLAFEE